MLIDIADVRFQRLVRHLHSLGPRALGEFLCQINRTGYLVNALEQYERITPERLLAIVGSLDFPPQPPTEVK